MKRLSLVFSLVLFAVGISMAQRTITGTVTDDKGEALIGASILVKGTSSGTVTDIDGNYTLEVPAEGKSLEISYTGFSTQEVSLGVSNVVDIVMKEGVQLSEVVVTGLGIRKEKKALGYGVSTIAAADISQRSETDVARLLRGKATGVDITQTSGLAGSGTNVIIRGYSSITGSNQPLFVVDGVPFNSDTNTDRSSSEGGATASSRFLDLDPNNIAEISILKGLSATVLYGEAGRNGVILITTKNGNVGATDNKKFEVSVVQNLSFTQLANLPVYQDTYGNGFGGDFGWFFSNWGAPFSARGTNGVAADGTIEHPYDQAQYNDDFPEYKGARYPYQPYKSLENFFQTGVVSNTSLSVDKSLGNGAAVNANYSYLSDEGFTPENTFTKHNLGIGGTTKLANGLTVRTSLNFISLNRQAPPAAFSYGSGSGGNASVFGDLLYTPRSIDLLNLPYQSPIDGSQVYYRRGSAIQNPLWGLYNTRDKEAVERYFGNVQLNYEVAPWLNATYRVGVDQYTQKNRREINKGGSQVPDGALATFIRYNRITDHVLNLMPAFKINDNFDFDGLVGLNLRRETNDYSGIFSTNQFIFDLFTHQNFIDHNSSSSRSEQNTIGAYATATLGFRNFFYLNLQARNDWTSVLEKANRSIFYPSASISFVPTEAIPGLQNSAVLNYLKLRVGYGTSAGYPSPYNTRSVLGTNTNVFLSNGGQALNTNTVSDQLGNPNLKPELHEELEFGVEGRFLNNRIGIDLSLYDKQSSDLIFPLQLDPATGYTNTTVNVAAVSNKGIELGLNITPVRGKLTWDINLNYTKNKNIVEKIADGIDQFAFAGFSNLGNFAIPGQPYGIMLGTPFQHLNGQIVTDGRGEYVPGSEIDVIGNPNPNFTANWINTISFKGFTFNFHWQYIDGGDIYSVLTATMFARGNTKDTDFDRYIPIVLKGVKEDGTPNDVQGYAGDAFFNAYFFADEGAIFDGTVIRLREIGLSYEVPARMLKNTPFGSLSLRLSGENLFFKAPNFPEYINYDPEVSSLGVGNGRGFEFLTAPTSKKFGATLSFTF